MKAIFFDTGPLISLSTNNLLNLLPRLKEKYKGRFFITPSVKKEAVLNPLNTKKFKFEALQNLRLLNEQVLELYDDEKLKDMTLHLQNLANHIFEAHDNPIKIVHFAETEVIASAILTEADAIIIDEFTTRAIIENPLKVKDRLQKKLHTKIKQNNDTLSKFQKKVKNLKVIRSIELVTIAYDFGLLDSFVPRQENLAKDTLLDAVLWGLKLHGCSITSDEIDRIKKIENL